MKIVLIMVVFCLVSLYLYHENTALQVTKQRIIANKLPNAFDGYKIAHISDFHNTTSRRLSNRIVDEINRNKVDIVVVTGDVIDARRTNIKVVLDFLSKLVENNIVYYVPGNHESRIKEYNKFKKQISELGVNVLENEAKLLTKSETKINLLGIKDPTFAREYYVEDSEIVEKEIEYLEYNKELYTVLLSHRPEVFETYVKANIDLVFTGHAHGGQIKIPFIGGVIAPVQGLFPKYTEGVHKEKGTTMVISRGIGNSAFPFRINNRPELVIVELKNK